MNLIAASGYLAFADITAVPMIKEFGAAQSFREFWDEVTGLRISSTITWTNHRGRIR
jgi:hypothetical protein